MAVLEDFYEFGKYFPPPVRRGWAAFINAIKAGGGGGGGGGVFVSYFWDTSTSPIPTTGYVRADQASYPTITNFYVSATDSGGVDRRPFWLALRPNDGILIRTETKTLTLLCQSTFIDNGTWLAVPVLYYNSNGGSFLDNEPVSIYGLFYGATNFLDLTDTPDTYAGHGNKLVAVNAGANALEFQTVASVLARGTFLNLSDTPDSYSGQATKFVAVNSTGTALEFVTGSGGGGATTFLQLTDTPSSYSGQAHKSVRVNAAASGLEFSLIIPDWATATSYLAGDFVYADYTIWKCSTAHTSTGQTLDTTKFTRWMQANEPTTTGLIYGCTLSIVSGPAVFKTSGSLFFVYRDPALGNASMNYVNQITVGTQQIAINTTWQINHFWESNDGSFFSTADINETYLRSAVYFGYAVKDKNDAWIVINRPMAAWNTGPFAQDLTWFAMGPTLLGEGITYGTTGLRLSLGDTSIFGFSVNFRPDLSQAPKNVVALGSFTDFTMTYLLQDGSRYQLDATEIIDNFYESAPGVVTAIPAGKAAIHRVFGIRQDSGVCQFFVQMPQFYYNSLDQAVNVYFNYDETNTVICQRLGQGAFFLGWVAVVSGATTWPPPGMARELSPAERLASGVVICAPRSELERSEQSLAAIRGGVLEFRGLVDTPDSYLGQASRTVIVNAAETGLEFGEIKPGSLVFAYRFSTTTTVNPAAGTIRLNNATPANANVMYVDFLDDDGVDRSIAFGALRLGDVISLADINSDTVYAYRVTAPPTQDLTNTYTTIPVAFVTSRGTFANNERLYAMILLFGPNEFVELEDTPDSYTGQANKVPVVAATELELEFRSYTFLSLMDTPNSYSGSALMPVRVNSAATALEFYKGYDTFLSLLDTPTTYAGQGTKVVAVKSTEDGVEFVDSGSGATTFLALSDTPNSYVGQANKFLRVASAETGVVFGTASFLDLSDTPANYSGAALKVVQVNSGATGLQYGSTPSTAVWNANQLQGRTVSATAPTDGEILRYTTQWEPYDVPYATWQTLYKSTTGQSFFPICSLPATTLGASYGMVEIEAILGGYNSAAGNGRRRIRVGLASRGTFQVIYHEEDGDSRGASLNFDIRVQQDAGGDYDVLLALTGQYSVCMVRASTFKCYEYGTQTFRTDGPVLFDINNTVAWPGGTNVFDTYSQTTNYPPTLYLSNNLSNPMWRGKSLALAQLPKSLLFTQGSAISVAGATNTTILNATINKPFILQMIGAAATLTADYTMNFTVTIDGTVVMNDLLAVANASFPHLLGGASQNFPLVLSGNSTLLVQVRKNSTGVGTTTWRASYETLEFS